MITTETDWRAEPIPTLPGLWRVVGKGQTICSGVEEWQAKLIAAAPDLLAYAKHADYEINAIRARSGAPISLDWGPNGPMQSKLCTEEWWNTLTEMGGAALKKADEKI